MLAFDTGQRISAQEVHCFIPFFQSFGLPFFHGKIVQQHNAEGEGEQSDDGKRGNGVSLRVRYLPEKPNYAIQV